MCISKYIWSGGLNNPNPSESIVRFGFAVILEIDRDESPVLDNDYSYSRYIRVNTHQITDDLSNCFKVGERYILYGSKHYSQYPKTERYRDTPVGFTLEDLLYKKKFIQLVRIMNL